MSILFDAKTPVVVQGITGKEGSYWTRHMRDLGTNVVAGVTPGKGDMEQDGIPVCDHVADAVEHHGAKASMIFVPPKFTRGAVVEALDAGIRLIVTIADGIPLHEMAEIRTRAKANGAMVIGGNTSGVISPGVAMMGCFPYWIERVYKEGRIGIMTRSGSLTNEVTSMVVAAGYGVSTLAGVGGDPVPGTRFAELLPLYEADADTDAVVIIGELGGTMEEEVAEMMKQGTFTKPLVAFLGGRTAPPGVRMGHAGTIATGGKGSVKDKIEALESAGALVADRPSRVGALLRRVLGERK